MSDLNELLGRLPIDRIAQSLGVDEGTARDAVEKATAALAGGMEANARDEAGAASLQQALLQHQDSNLGDGDVDIDQVDTDDGDKIVGHVFGDNRDQVAQQLGGLGGGMSSGLMKKLLPMLAPIVMGYIAKRMRSGGQQAQAQTQRADSGFGLDDILGGLLGGKSGGGGGGNILSDVLGGLLGGGRR